jgi:hypothetical protein
MICTYSNKNNYLPLQGVFIVIYTTFRFDVVCGVFYCIRCIGECTLSSVWYIMGRIARRDIITHAIRGPARAIFGKGCGAVINTRDHRSRLLNTRLVWRLRIHESIYIYHTHSLVHRESTWRVIYIYIYMVRSGWVYDGERWGRWS